MIFSTALMGTAVGSISKIATSALSARNELKTLKVKVDGELKMADIKTRNQRIANLEAGKVRSDAYDLENLNNTKVVFQSEEASFQAAIGNQSKLGLASSVRPIITYALVAFLGYQWFETRDPLITATILDLASVAVGYWFGQRIKV